MIQEKKFYLTRDGLERVKKEYESLKSLKMAKITGEAPKLWQSEDLNPEYVAFQEDLGFLETRLYELGNVLKNTELIKPPLKEKRDEIELGSKVLVEVDGQADEFTIVGSLEANPSLGKISDESPVGKQLIGHKVGEEVVISSPVKTIYKIKKIRYQQN